jgi:hypothetical protein
VFGRSIVLSNVSFIQISHFKRSSFSLEWGMKSCRWVDESIYKPFLQCFLKVQLVSKPAVYFHLVHIGDRPGTCEQDGNAVLCFCQWISFFPLWMYADAQLVDNSIYAKSRPFETANQFIQLRGSFITLKCHTHRMPNQDNSNKERIQKKGWALWQSLQSGIFIASSIHIQIPILTLHWYETNVEIYVNT